MVTGLYFNSYHPRIERYITLYWDEHPNVNVTKYDIYRRKKKGNPIIKIGTVNRGTTSYTDYLYKLAPSSSGDLMAYGVKAYFSPDQTYSELNMKNVYGEYGGVEKIAAEDSENNQQPIEYKLSSNYPNPFNPTTQISYQIPNDGFVNLTVYNSLGQEIAALVNQQQSIGRYTVQFNANNLSSGIYFYRIAAGEFNSVKKMLLVR